MVGQSDAGDINVVPIVLIALVVGILPGAIAQSKGYSFTAWWLFGAVLFIVALPLSLMLPGVQPGNAASSQGPSTPNIVWTHTGGRYLFGYTMTPPSYGIWDREAPGPPVQAFPYSEHGKAEAFRRYGELEPSSVELSRTTPPAPWLH